MNNVNGDTIAEVCKGVATLTCGYFAGTCLYISLSEYHALGELEEKERLKAFSPIYKRVAKLQQGWLGVSALSCGASYLMSSNPKIFWIAAGSTLFSIGPYTAIFMIPTNYSLINLNHSLNKSNEWINTTFTKWSKMHAVRTVVSSAVFGAMLYGLWKNI